MFVYQLEHEYWKNDCDLSGFRLGYYTSLEEAEQAREQYLTLPGFIDHPEGFKVTKHIVNVKSCSKIWTVDLIFDEYMEDYMAVGIFESKEAAEKYIEFYKLLRGDDVNKGEFFIEEHELGKSEWKEGFVTCHYNA